MSKVCTKCKVEKPIEEFYVKKERNNYVYTHCKECFSIQKLNKYKVDEAYRNNMLQGARTKAQRRRRRIGALKQKFGCIDCGYNHSPHALHFDHIDPSEKLFIISRLINSRLDKLFAEIRKCVVRCANCHAIKTQAEGQHMSRKDK